MRQRTECMTEAARNSPSSTQASITVTPPETPLNLFLLQHVLEEAILGPLTRGRTSVVVTSSARCVCLGASMSIMRFAWVYIS